MNQAPGQEYPVSLCLFRTSSRAYETGQHAITAFKRAYTDEYNSYEKKQNINFLVGGETGNEWSYKNCYELLYNFLVRRTRSGMGHIFYITQDTARQNGARYRIIEHSNMTDDFYYIPVFELYRTDVRETSYRFDLMYNIRYLLRRITTQKGTVPKYADDILNDVLNDDENHNVPETFAVEKLYTSAGIRNMRKKAHLLGWRRAINYWKKH
jgi:hypothetical protein